MALAPAVDAIRQTFVVEDVTEDPDRLNNAFAIVAEGYAKLSSRHLDLQEVREALCNDIYHRRGLARTFVLTGASPHQEHVGVLGTFRMVLGSPRMDHPDLSPLDAMDLVVPPGGWATFGFAGFCPAAAVEFGRLVILPECRTELAKQMQLPVWITRTLFEHAFCLAVRTYRKSQAWAIAPPHVIDLVRAGGTVAVPVPHITLQYERHARLFQQYDRYWLRSNPWLYKLIVFPETPVRAGVV